MKLTYMEDKDKSFVMSIDKHVNEEQYANRVLTKSGYVIWDGKEAVGLMHHAVLWDNLPFLNLIYIKEECRGKGYGTEAMRLWEEDMGNRGYKMVLISTQVDEDAQHWYRKLGYVECGGLLMNGTPFEQPMEMFMRKIL